MAAQSKEPISAPAVVITGCSSGIGYGTVRVLAQQGFKVFGSVRKLADGERLRQELGEQFTPLLFDVTDEKAVAAAAHKVRQALAGHRLAGLVNNAGVSFPGPAAHQPVSEFRTHLEINTAGTFIVTQAFLPLLGTDGTLRGSPGRIINVSSTSGSYGAPFMGAYAASKHAMQGYTDSLRRELLLFGVDVILVVPGHVRTALWDKVQAFDASQYAGTPYAGPLQKFLDFMLREGRASTHTPEDVGRVVGRALTSTNPWARYVHIFRRFMNWTLPLSLPTRWVDRAMATPFDLLPAVKAAKQLGPE